MGGFMSDKDKKKKRKKVMRPRVHVRRGERAVPSREKLHDDFDDDEEGIFTAQDEESQGKKR